MSAWKRLRGLFSSKRAVVVTEAALDAPEAPSEEAPLLGAEAERILSPEEQLSAMADGGTFNEPRALSFFAEMQRGGRAARALDLARRILELHPKAAELSLSVAETLSARGDDGAARDQLASTLAAPTPALRALLLVAEIDEREGDFDGARQRYEQILARDIDYPRVHERVERLRERGEPRRDLAGATLATDGALTRGRYRVEQELGRGGAGTVFAALDLMLERRFALKIYHRRGKLERERLTVEARMPASLEHPGVVRVFDLDPELGAIAMEWVRGGSVRRELERVVVPFPRARRWLLTALDALAFVHDSGIVHRDVKPSNMLLRSDDIVVLTDFGLAMPLGAKPVALAGGGEGTLRYMPPEQREAVAAHPSADVHAFGVTMREVLGRTTGDEVLGWLEVAHACTRRDAKSRPTIAWLRETLGRVDGG